MYILNPLTEFGFEKTPPDEKGKVARWKVVERMVSVGGVNASPSAAMCRKEHGFSRTRFLFHL